MKEVIVFQMGKVASTSIVNSLNRIEGVRAHQSHFLGRMALRGILDGLLNPSVSDYFHHHNMGQLVENVALTRLVERHRQGLAGADDKLIVLSLARNPIDWLRSSITQDIAGHAPNFVAAIGEAEKQGKSEDDVLALGITRTIERLSAAYELIRWTPPKDIETKLNEVVLPKLQFQGQADVAAFKGFYYLFLRPLTWFDFHFQGLMGFDVTSMEAAAPNIYRKNPGWCTCYVIRYEDIGSSMPWVLGDLNINATWQPSSDNVSENKQRDAIVRAAFASPQADKLRKLVSEVFPSRFVKQFGY